MWERTRFCLLTFYFLSQSNAFVKCKKKELLKKRLKTVQNANSFLLGSTDIKLFQKFVIKVSKGLLLFILLSDWDHHGSMDHTLNNSVLYQGGFAMVEFKSTISLVVIYLLHLFLLVFFLFFLLSFGLNIFENYIFSSIIGIFYLYFSGFSSICIYQLIHFKASNITLLLI